MTQSNYNEELTPALILALIVLGAVVYFSLPALVKLPPGAWATWIMCWLFWFAVVTGVNL